MEHIDSGRPWDLFGRTRLAEILPPKTGEAMSDWYKGTSDAVYQNIGFVEDYSPELVLVVSGDHIYTMDYDRVIAFHRSRKADATICLIRVPYADVRHFGIAETDNKSRITKWVEKPQTAKSNLASMGIYVFNRKPLTKALTMAAKKGGTDFAKDVIPIMLQKRRAYGFVFDGYWRDVGTIHSYWQTNMDMLNTNSGFRINDWRVKTNLSAKGDVGDRPSAYISRASCVRNSLVARGCVIEGTVTNSILSPGVRVARHAKVLDSVIFHDTTIGTSSTIECSIIDKQVKVGASVEIGSGKLIANKKSPKHLASGITLVGKLAQISDGITIGKNCVITPDARLAATRRKKIGSGSTV
jgi:glucose-1-phosphate adenylyltransferase